MIFVISILNSSVISLTPTFMSWMLSLIPELDWVAAYEVLYLCIMWLGLFWCIVLHFNIVFLLSQGLKIPSHY